MEVAEVDMVEHPPHYITEAGIEAIDVIEHYGFGVSFHLGNVLKYLLRAGRKTENRKTDCQKAMWYLMRYIEDDESNLVWPEANPGAVEWHSPPTIIAAFGLTDTSQGRAVGYLLEVALEEDCEADNLDLAIAQLERAIEECA